MEWFIAVVAVAALGVAALAAAGGVGQMSKDPVRDTYRQQLPDHPLTAVDLQQARFGVSLRGYAMAQVDDLIDRLAREIADRDARIAELTGDPLSEPRSAFAEPRSAFAEVAPAFAEVAPAFAEVAPAFAEPVGEPGPAQAPHEGGSG